MCKLIAGLGASPLTDVLTSRWLQGMAVSGSSVGAMGLFEWRIKLYPPNPLRLLPGLGLLDGYVAAPHFDRFKAVNWAHRTIGALGGQGVIGLDEATALVGHYCDFEVVGPGSTIVINGGETLRFQGGKDVHVDPITSDAPDVLGVGVRAVAPKSTPSRFRVGTTTLCRKRIEELRVNLRNIASLLLSLAIASACGDPVADPGEVPQGDQPPTGDSSIVDWEDPTKVVEVGGGWTIAACHGDAPILCVSKDGVAQGGVEATSYDIGALPHVDPEADSDAQLRSLAEGFTEAIGSDRSEGCGPDYRFEPIGPEAFVLGNTPGLAFGFQGTMSDGRPSELNLQYATIVGDRIVNITAIAYDEDGCPGRDDLGGFTSEMLAEFRPHLEEVLPESPLPSLED